MGRTKQRSTTGKYIRLEKELDKHRINHVYNKHDNSLEISRPFGIIKVNVPKSDDREYFYISFNTGQGSFFVGTDNYDKLINTCTTWDAYDDWFKNKK